MNKENCALKLVDEIILYYDARSKKRQINSLVVYCNFDEYRMVLFLIQHQRKRILNSNLNTLL